MHFEKPQNIERQQGLVTVSRQKHPELWDLIDKGNERRRFTDDSPELSLLAQEIEEYLHGRSTPEFEYYTQSGKKEEKVRKLTELIQEFFTQPTQRNARKIGDFFW